MKRDPFTAALFATPLVLLVLLGAVVPLGALLLQSVIETEVRPALPRTAAALRLWDGAGLPEDIAFEALAADLAALRAAGAPGTALMARATVRLSADLPSMEAVLANTAARAPETRAVRGVSVLVADPAWSEPEGWAVLRRATGDVSGFHLLAALGLRRTASGGIEGSPQAAEARAALAGGIGAALLATVLCLALSWPLARLIAEAPPARAALLAAATALPLLAGEGARAMGWSVIAAGPLAFLVALVLGLLPLMALPVAISLRQAGPRLPRAAAALGARPWFAFRRVHLPLARRGVVAGCALVFTQALGALALPAALLTKGGLAGTDLAAAAQAGHWSEAGALAAWLLLPTLLAGLLAALLLRPRRGVAA